MRRFADTPLPADDAVHARIRRVRELMNDCLAERLDLDLMAREACYSRFHFLRTFRAVYNTTPHQYLTLLRIRRAQELLATSGMSVTDVCFEVGFQSPGSFSTLFQRHVGSSPLCYRSRMSFHVDGLRVHTQIPGCYIVRVAAGL